MDIDDLKVTSKVFKIFDLWNLTIEEKLGALGVPINKLLLEKYKNDSAIFENKDLLNRTENLLVIYKYLNLLFPANAELANSWMKTRNKAFDGNMPIETIIDMGLPGLIYIRRYLEAALYN